MAAQGGDKGVSDHREYEGNQEYEGHQEHEGKKKIKLDYFYECLDGINIWVFERLLKCSDFSHCYPENIISYWWIGQKVLFKTPMFNIF